MTNGRYSQETVRQQYSWVLEQAHTTHQWVSDMLEDMTIDSRSESLGHSQGSGNLQMSKAGMKLMTPDRYPFQQPWDCDHAIFYQPGRSHRFRWIF